MHRMKNTLIVAAGCMAIATCSLQAKTRAPAGPQEEIVRAGNDFAVRIYRQLSGESGNLFFSPSSIHTAMSMTLTGAKGRTGQQMRKVLGFGDTAPHKGYAALLKALAPGKDAGYELHVANALWGQKDYPWLKNFLAATKDNYGAGLREVDYARAAEAARKTINDWVEDQTAKKIKDLISSGVLNILTRLVLTNAIYFKGNWTTQFDKKATRGADFTTLGGKKIKAPLMHRKGRYGYMADRKTGLQVASIPYKGDELSMVVLLPKSPEDLGALTATLSADRLAGWIAAMRKQEIDLFLPRFKMTGTFRLKDVLMKMGIVDAFSLGSADFSAMNGRKDLYISAVIHKAFVDVNEEGTEAAAATAVVMTGGMRITPTFRADRPFLFLIRHNPTGTILFMGRLTEPGGDQPAGVQDAGAAARKFWRAVASADAATMKKLYAPKITVKRGSELLKAKYGLGTDRGSDAVVVSDKLVAAYRTMFDKPDVKAKWISIFKKFTGDKITIAPADKDNSPFAGAKRGDTIMTVNTGDGNLIFVLRNVGGKGWLVVAERTDY